MFRKVRLRSVRGHITMSYPILLLMIILFPVCGSENLGENPEKHGDKANSDNFQNSANAGSLDERVATDILEPKITSKAPPEYGEYDCDAINIQSVRSEKLIEGECGNSVWMIEYAGIGVIADAEGGLEKVMELNEFLVLNKNVELKNYGTKLLRNGSSVIVAEVFVGGESVNLRLIKSGLVKLGEFPKNFERRNLFVQASLLAQERKVLSESRRDQINSGEKPMGCGTLPCRPQK